MGSARVLDHRARGAAADRHLSLRLRHADRGWRCYGHLVHVLGRVGDAQRLMPLPDYFLPLAGSALIATQNGAKRNARWVALYTTLFTLGVALSVATSTIAPGFQFVEGPGVARPPPFAYHMGVDGISLLFVILTTAFLMPLCILRELERRSSSRCQGIHDRLPGALRR